MDADYEQQRAELERQFPGWRIWAVPYGYPETTHINWSAQPLPLIQASSVQELADRIRTAHSQPPDGSPSLASWRSYTARRRQLRAFEETAGRTWRRMRADADRWPRFPLQHCDRRSPADETGVAGRSLPDITA